MDLSIFQSVMWEEFKLKTGYEKSHRIEGILVLQKKLSLGRTMLYSPMVSQAQLDRIQNTAMLANRQEYGTQFMNKLKTIARENKAIFYRLELNTPIIHNSESMIPKRFKKAFEEMQPEHNWLLDISKSEDEIKAEMKQKGRYNIKIAQKNNIRVISTEKPGKELDIFFKQYRETGKRHEVSYREKSYFTALLEILGKKDYARIYIAWKEETPLASAILLKFGKSILYLYGGSDASFRNLMAPYLLHWQIIKKAKEKGYIEYNFLGVAPNDNPSHPWAGITRFKKQFGGTQVDILGSYDLILKPIEYQLFKVAERTRRPR